MTKRPKRLRSGHCRSCGQHVERYRPFKLFVRYLLARGVPEMSPVDAQRDVRFRATAVIGCVSSETARSRMTRLRHGPCYSAIASFCADCSGDERLTRSDEAAMV